MGLPEVRGPEAYGAPPDEWCRNSSWGSHYLGVAIHHGVTVAIHHGAHEVMIIIRHGVAICYEAHEVMASLSSWCREVIV